MGWLRATKKRKNPQATELSQLKEKLRPVSDTLQAREDELAGSHRAAGSHKRNPASDREHSCRYTKTRSSQQLEGDDHDQNNHRSRSR